MEKTDVVTEGKFKEYSVEIQQSYVLEFTPYRLHKNADGTFVIHIRVYDGKVYVLDDVATMEWMKYSKLVYFAKGDGSSGVALQGDSGNKGPVGRRGPTGKRGVAGPEGPPAKTGQMGPVGSRGEIGARGEKDDKGDTGDVGQQKPIGPQGSTVPRGVQGAKWLRGVASIQGPLEVQGPVGSTGGQGERGLKGDKGIQGSCGAKGDSGERGDRAVKGEKGILGAISSVLSVLADHLPIQLGTRYGEKIALSSHVSGDRSSTIELSGDVGTQRNVSKYHEPTWHFNAKFLVNGQGHEMANAQKATGHGNFLEVKDSAYHCPYDLADIKVNAIYIVYNLGKYDSTGLEHNYLFSCGMGDNHRDICFLKDENTMRVYGVAGKPTHMDISHFPTSFYNPCHWAMLSCCFCTCTQRV